MLTVPISALWNRKASSWNWSVFSTVRGMNLDPEPVRTPSTKHLHTHTHTSHTHLTIKVHLAEHNHGSHQINSPRLYESISGTTVRIRWKSGDAALHVDPQGHVVVLLDRSLNVNNVSQVVMMAWSLIKPVICNEIMGLFWFYSEFLTAC